ncbi:hypothetical protein [Streptomyces sp. NPDC057509]|uniref:hypothetical protein n=1 Tax=Streptomyces sp. NPDC057509 TaxID=3346152 RepID=UPI0036CA1C43
MRSGPPHSAGRLPAPQSVVYRTIAVCGGIAVAVTLLVLGVAVATWPSPPPPGTTDERQLRYSMERGAGEYAHSLFDASRSGPLTEAGLAAVPLPAEGTVEVAGLSREGDVTVVTFSMHALYGRPGDLKRTTACYRVELVERLDYPNLKPEADAACSARTRPRGAEPRGAQTNDSASGPSGGTRPSAAARVSRPRIAA